MSDPDSIITTSESAFAFDTWPGMDLRYLYNAGPKLQLIFGLDCSRYDSATDTMWMEQAVRDAATYDELVEQWSALPVATDALLQVQLNSTLHPSAAPLFQPANHEALSNYLGKVAAYLRAIVAEESATPPDALVLDWTVDTKDLATGSMLELTVSLHVLRITKDEENGEPVEIRETVLEMAIAPLMLAGATDIEGRWAPFATAFAAAFPVSETGAMVPAMGAVPEGRAGKELPGLWVLRFGNNKEQGIWLDISVPAPVLMLPLWSQRLLSHEAAVPQYSSATGLSLEKDSRLFERIDLNLWAVDFLRSLNDLLGWDLGAIETIADDAESSAPPVAPNLQSLKERLAVHLSGQLQAVEAGASPVKEQVAAAGASLHQRLSKQLSATSEAVLCYPVAGANGAAEAVLWIEGILRVQPGSDDPELRVCIPLTTATDTNFIAAILPPAAPVESVRTVSGDLKIQYIGVGMESGEGESTINWLQLLGAAPAPVASPLLKQLPVSNVPMALRRCPDAPLIVAEEAAAPASPQSVADALLWSYAFTYQNRKALQDRHYLSLSVNSAMLNSRNTVEPPSSLFTALAAFVSCRVPIEDDLRKVLGAGGEAVSAVELQKARVALRAYNTIATAVADAWLLSSLHSVPTLDARTDFQYSYVESAAADGALQVTIQQPSSGPVLKVDIAGYQAEPVAGSAHSTQYRNDAGLLSVEAAHDLPRSIQWTGLRVLEEQNASVRIVVRRNELLGDHTINPALVLSSSMSQSFTPVVPHNEVPDPIDSSTWMNSGGPYSLPAILTGLFQAILRPGFGQQLLQLGCTYRYPISPELPVEGALPVLMTAQQSFNDGKDYGTNEGFIHSVSETIRKWKEQTSPPPHGYFSLDLVLYSKAEHAPLPLLHFRDLRISADGLNF